MQRGGVEVGLALGFSWHVGKGATLVWVVVLGVGFACWLPLVSRRFHFTSFFALNGKYVAALAALQMRRQSVPRASHLAEFAISWFSCSVPLAGLVASGFAWLTVLVCWVFSRFFVFA